MAKYPCGVCKRNVRTSAILCTGTCSKWFHFKCVQLCLSDIKHMEKDDSVEEWKCSNCSLEAEVNDNLLPIAGVCVNKEEQFNCSTLADELNKSILNENEELKQELHLAKNNSSLYVLELEDKLKEYEEHLQSKEKLLYESEKELQNKITFLEHQLKHEKEARESLVKQVDEESRDSFTHKDVLIKNCDHCTIYKEESKKMLDTIRSLEKISKLLENECLEKQNQINKLERVKLVCLKCFPPLKSNNDKSQTPSAADKWHKVTATSHCKKTNIYGSDKISAAPCFTTNNPFQVLQNDLEDVISDNVVQTGFVGEVNSSGLSEKNISSVNSTKVRKRKGSNEGINNTKKQKILLCADSHGRNLAFHLNNQSKAFDTVGFVRPGGLAGQILNYDNIDGEKLGQEDVLTIVCGSNDISRNEAHNAINAIERTLEKYSSNRVVLLDIPSRHDLKVWSCVNEEVRRINKLLESLSEKFSNVSLVKVSAADRQLYTRHGMHLNERGKGWLARQIFSALAEKTSIHNPTSQSLIAAEETTSMKNYSLLHPLPPPNAVEIDSNTESGSRASELTPTSQPLRGAEEEKASMGNDSLPHPVPPP